MKIIKIELQNINSLKTDYPIVIDFEGTAFRDIGLFAITGSTGAGKTTILDAITIAMYHSVPRFNKSNIKAGLEDVVSYGANEAMARVTFDTKENRFEAQWSMRLAAKTGKKLSNPKEEVRLKNLTTGSIIAEKKREVQNEITQITQLSYDQFLRSVMLAQGEFAAFLSASAADKGTLLEQITGEDIYKKIGETISDRIFEERKKLEKIRAKINTEDLLSESSRLELYTEEQTLIEKIKTIETESKETERIINWFKKETELEKTSQEIETSKMLLENEKEASKDFMNLLELHEKAEPFKEAADELNRIDKDLQQKKLRLEELTVEIVTNKVGFESVKNQEENKKKSNSEAENEFKLWLPRLEKVTKLDAEITNHQRDFKAAQQKITILSQTLAQLHTDKQQKEELKKKNEITIQNGEIFLAVHKNAIDIEKRLTDWNSKLTLRKNTSERIVTIADNLKLNEKELLSTQTNIEKTALLLTTENSALEQLKLEITNVATLLATNNLEELLQIQKKSNHRNNLLKELQALAANYNELKTTEERLILEKTDLEQNASERAKAITKLQGEITRSQKALKDAETILDLERTILSFNEERNKLEANKPCPLCGSTIHPYVEKYAAIEISKSHIEVERRKASLENLNKNEKTNAIQLASIKTKLENNLAQTQNIKRQLEEVQIKFIALETHLEIKNQDKLEAEMVLIQTDLDQLAEKIATAQQLQKQKNILDQLFNTQLEKVTASQTEIVKHREKLDGINKTIRQNSDEMKSLRIETDEMESILKKELSAFDLEIPDVSETILFIKRLENGISQYHNAKEKVAEVKNKLIQLTSDIKNIEDHQHEKGTDKTKIEEEATNATNAMLKLTLERNEILPSEISTDTKRNNLQKSVLNTKEALDIITLELNRLITHHATLVKEKENIEKELITNQNNLAAKSTLLNESLAFTIFHSKSEIEKAILSHNERTKYIALRKQLDDKALELKTLETKLHAEIARQTAEKNFDSTPESILMKQQEQEQWKGYFQKRSGEIKKQFELDDQIKLRNKNVVAEIETQDKTLKVWTDLMKLLGGSKQAFNTYVQRLTLQNLINLANLHLFKLNKRYSLELPGAYKSGEELNFMLIDHYQTDEARLVDTSSGGEKFLISLALALGLSDLASKNVSIGSLFIDEGFGTLDNQTLETVVSSLETLQSQGKMIGIISHVENLKERIPTQIQVLKKSNGVSEVLIV